MKSGERLVELGDEALGSDVDADDVVDRGVTVLVADDLRRPHVLGRHPTVDAPHTLERRRATSLPSSSPITCLPRSRGPRLRCAS